MWATVTLSVITSEVLVVVSRTYEKWLQYIAHPHTAFLVNPQTYVSVTYGTCEYVWGSRVGSGFLEYSYVNWVSRT